MKRISYIFFIFLASFCFLAAQNADYVFAKQSKTHSRKASVKESVEKRATARKAAAKKVAKADPERDLWLKRANEGELLTGKASWFGKDFHAKPTASGLPYDMHTFTAAHRTLPLGTVVKVTDASNGKSVVVCVTDRGPYVKGRIIDLSYAAAKRLDMANRGVANVRLEVVSDETGAPLKSDHAFFIKYPTTAGQKKVGPFHSFADAAAMREAISQAHPEAEVDVAKTAK